MKVLKIGAIALILIGMLCIAAGFLSRSKTTKFLESATRSTGVVTGFEEGTSGSSDTGDRNIIYRPIVEFKTATGEQITFTAKIGSQTKSYTEGDSITVHYQSDNPHNARIDSFLSLWLVPLIAWGIGAVLFLVGGIFGIIVYRAHRLEKWLKLHGMQVMGTYQGVKHCTAGYENTVSAPYRVLVEWRDIESDRVHTFESPDIWYNPTPLVEGKSFQVTIDPNNLNKYLVDISMLPKKEPQALAAAYDKGDGSYF